MGYSILELVLRRLREDGFTADIAFPGQMFPQISDADMTFLARDVARQIESELEYPGQIKVNVVRETRAIDYAK